MSKRLVPPIAAAPVTLRLLTEDDLPRTRAWRNQPQVRKWFIDSNAITEAQHRSWYEQYRDRDDDFVFIIEDHESRRPVGQVSLYHLDWRSRRAEFGRLMIGESAALRHGYAREATRALLSHAFDAWDLQEVRLEMLPGNVPAGRLYESCGFREVDGRPGLVTMRITRP